MPVDSRTLSTLSAIVTLTLLACPAPIAAQTKPFESGTIALPVTGLMPTLPADKVVRYQIGGSYSISDDGGTFEGRDVIDVIDRKTGKLVGGHWIHSAYFNAGDCNAVLGEIAFAQPWTAQAKYWGQNWQIRGGIFDFKNDLGQKPAVAICRKEASGRSLLMYRHLLDKPGSAAGLKAVGGSKVLAAVSQAYDGKKYERSGKNDKSILKNRGKVLASRKVKLPFNKFDITLPDDGSVWLVNTSQSSDFLSRVAPSLPDGEIEVAYAANLDCKAMFDALNKQPRNMTEEARPTANAASGWLVGPVLNVEGEPERVLCYKTPKGAAMVGLFLQPGDNDATQFRAILDAIRMGAP